MVTQSGLERPDCRLHLEKPKEPLVITLPDLHPTAPAAYPPLSLSSLEFLAHTLNLHICHLLSLSVRPPGKVGLVITLSVTGQPVPATTTTTDDSSRCVSETMIERKHETVPYCCEVTGSLKRANGTPWCRCRQHRFFVGWIYSSLRLFSKTRLADIHSGRKVQIIDFSELSTVDVGHREKGTT